LSRDSINKNINGKEDAGELLNLEFECYGPQGVQIIVGALTDNTNRTISSLNGYLAKLHGEIAKTNSVKIYFEKVGLILLSKTNNLTLDNIMEITMEYEIIDLIDEEECFVIKTSPDDFYKVKDVLAKNNLNIIEAEIKMLPLSPISSLNDDTKTRLDTFLNACEEDEDIQ
jgi:YebC/PmpR family DNA-binding regulatory protein